MRSRTLTHSITHTQRSFNNLTPTLRYHPKFLLFSVITFTSTAQTNAHASLTRRTPNANDAYVISDVDDMESRRWSRAMCDAPNARDYEWHEPQLIPSECDASACMRILCVSGCAFRRSHPHPRQQLSSNGTCSHSPAIRSEARLSHASSCAPS